MNYRPVCVCTAAVPRWGSRRAEIHPVVFGLSAAHTRSVALEIFHMSLLPLSLTLSPPLSLPLPLPLSQSDTQMWTLSMNGLTSEREHMPASAL